MESASMSRANDGAHASLVRDDQGDTDHLIVLARDLIPATRPFGHHIELDGCYCPVRSVGVDDDGLVHVGYDGHPWDTGHVTYNSPMVWVAIRETAEEPRPCPTSQLNSRN